MLKPPKLLSLYQLSHLRETRENHFKMIDITLRPLTAEVNNNDHPGTAQHTKGVVASYGCYLTPKTHPNIVSDKTLHGSKIPPTMQPATRQNY